MNPVAIAVSAVAAFVLSTAWYMAFGKQLARVSEAYADAGGPAPWKVLIELGRSLVVASVLSGLALRLGITDWIGATRLGLVAWVGFPVVLLVGSVIWENVPRKLAAIHSGDWLVKLVTIAVIVSVWR